MLVSWNANDDYKTSSRSWMSWACEVLDGCFFCVLLLSWLSSNHEYIHAQLTPCLWWGDGWDGCVSRFHGCHDLGFLLSVCSLCSEIMAMRKNNYISEANPFGNDLFHKSKINDWGRSKLIFCLSSSDAWKVQWLGMLCTKADSCWRFLSINFSYQINKRKDQYANNT
jgi:hypothetical protein